MRQVDGLDAAGRQRAGQWQLQCTHIAVLPMGNCVSSRSSTNGSSLVAADDVLRYRSERDVLDALLQRVNDRVGKPLRA